MNMVHEDTLLSQFIAFILFFLIRKSCAVYVISNSTDGWVNAVNKCTLATPQITISGNLIHTSYTSSDSEVWVGYYKRTTAFEYIGCTPKVNLPIHGKLPDTHVSKPSDCFPGCANNGIIAVTVQADSYDCYCLPSLPMNINEKGCTSSCLGMTGIPCGGNDKASIYRLSPCINASEIKNGDYCLSIQYNGDKVEDGWKSCNTQLRKVLCESERGLEPRSHQSNWSDAVNHCLSLRLRSSACNASRTPQSESSSDDKDRWTGSIWTGVFQDEVIYRSDQWRRGFTGIQYGYIKGSSGVLEFSNDDSKRWLCENETNTSTATMNTQLTTNPQGSSAASTVGILVAISVSVLVLILVIVFIIIFKKRVLKKTLEDKSHVTGNAEPVACSYSYAQMQQTSLNPTDFHAQNAINAINDDHNDYMYAEFDNTSLTTYDVTCKGGKRTDDNIGEMENNPANVYSKLGAEEKQQTYDKTVVCKATGNTNQHVLSSDKTYDSNVSTEYAFTNTCSELASKETSSDNIYDTSKQYDGIYNSVNENPTVNKTTDNVYGMK